ncbi:GNAT family N-acetyltransferase [Desulfosediminicola sp.]|uniref:GNAT family N-acetyltransferase n=1 Tax=Desulfosediminicola sp. TaxID=2886825 RepID=UPI003AF257D4
MNDHHSEPGYIWRSFDELTTTQLYSLLKLRQEVFVVEQDCAYLDADGLDQHSMHLLVYDENQKELIGYLRLIEPEIKYAEPAIGRLVTAEKIRGTGIARQMMRKAIDQAQDTFPGRVIRISAQLYLEKFYTSLGFTLASDPYDEDGIPHVEMHHGGKL